MRTDDQRSSANHCACHNGGGQCQGNNQRRPAINRRRFLAVGSGCVLGALGGASGASNDKVPPVDIGALSKFSEDGISEEFTHQDFFVIRYHGRLFAASTICPHMASILQRDPLDATRIKCGAHGSFFDAEGVVTVGPASSGLTRLGITVNKAGHVVVDPGKEFPQDKWTDKACYVEIK
jgi:nitrite reductase/ring-hydroxylating ferredoxin subunit